jgi:hypothetical protein
MMPASKPAPVEEWAPIFTTYFSDEQILNPSYAISQSADRLHCKLCDAPVQGEKREKHLARHRTELRNWRKRKAEAAEKARKQGLKRSREEKRKLKEAGQ